MDRSIEYILEVARCGGISKAARNLFITPSALSKFVIQKEEDLGVQIFHREGNKFTLTYPGERYVEMLKELRDKRQSIRIEMARLADMYSGRLRVGFQMSLAEFVTKRIVPELQDQCPQIRLFMEEASTSELWRLLKTNQLDLILALSQKRDDGLCYELITESPVVLAAAQGSPLEKAAVRKDGYSYPWIPDEVLFSEKLILDKGERNIRKYASYILSRDAKLRRSEITVTNARTALFCVEQDLGIIALPELQVRALHFEDRVRLYSFGPEEMKASLHVVWDPRSSLSTEISEFTRIVRTCLQ